MKKQTILFLTANPQPQAELVAPGAESSSAALVPIRRRRTHAVTVV